jgi:16S rRNA G966 N2-methylase RsmD
MISIKLEPMLHATTQEEKDYIFRELANISIEDAIQDFKKLQQLANKVLNGETYKLLSMVGNDVCNYFTMEERLNTIGQKAISFYTFYSNKEILSMRWPCIQKVLMNQYGKTLQTAEPRHFKYVFNLYFGAISIFRPIRAMEIYALFEPHTVLDPCCGWGGRLLGGCAINIQKYIGLDCNPNLREPYQKMKDFLKNRTCTEIQLEICDAVQYNYNSIEYDMVFTSPPYYNIEIYTGSRKMNKKQWDDEFYIPLFEQTYKYLQPNGIFAINICQEAYRRVLYHLFGEPDMKIPLKKYNKKNEYCEYIYVWKKGPSARGEAPGGVAPAR